MASKAKTVLLLKAKDSEITPDPETHLIHILRNLRNVAFLHQLFPPPRTVRAVHRACFFEDIDISKWAEKKNFAVGEATSKIAASLLQLNTLGKETGNAKQLCRLIVSSGVDNFPKPLLLPCSQKNRGAITTFLTENDFQVTSVMCYRTECNPKMKECFENLIISQGIPNIIVFFSPSGVEFSCEIIKAFSETPQCIAVGPTTEQAILEANLNLCKVSREPNPDCILEAVKSLM
ncbi:hydroxymethylbilane hydrolyase [Caerostris extrusa]|uniref:Hydroxymethylbilane hydrolyase n=1 Tax=Caerostris extrusa TaxID=172846 RepID=A0AAV4WX30_CAEEX|nr:hydroxymethylbilane hydrolyase [Caerostris extrusa]